MTLYSQSLRTVFLESSPKAGGLSRSHFFHLLLVRVLIGDRELSRNGFLDLLLVVVVADVLLLLLLLLLLLQCYPTYPYKIFL